MALLDFLGPIGNIASALIGSSAANKASNAQVAASDRASEIAALTGAEQLNFQKQMWDQIRQDLAPYQVRGAENLYYLNQFYGGTGPLFNFTREPGAEFVRQEGEKALDRGLRSIGLSKSGRALKEGMRYASDLASQEYGRAFDRFNVFHTNRFNRLSAIAGLGQQATTNLTSAGQNVAGNISNILGDRGANLANAALSGGAARAGGAINTANAITGGISGAINDAILMNALRR